MVGNKNKLSREPQLPLIDDEGNEVKYKGQGNPKVEIFNLNVDLIQIFKNNPTVVKDPKYTNPITNKKEPYTNINIQHLITYNSLLTGQIKFQIVTSSKTIKLTAYFDGPLYILKNKKQNTGEARVDLSIVHSMQNSNIASNINESDDEGDDNEGDNDDETLNTDFSM